MEHYELRGNVDFSRQKACLIKDIGRRELLGLLLSEMYEKRCSLARGFG